MKLCAIAFVSLAAPTLTSALEYTITELPFSWAGDINNHGDIAGRKSFSVGPGQFASHPILYTRNQEIVDLDPGAYVSGQALQLNDYNQVIGSVAMGDFSWTPQTGRADLPQNFRALGVNDAGFVVGTRTQAFQPLVLEDRGFLWRDGTYSEWLPEGSYDDGERLGFHAVTNAGRIFGWHLKHHRLRPVEFFMDTHSERELFDEQAIPMSASNETAFIAGMFGADVYSNGPGFVLKPDGTLLRASRSSAFYDVNNAGSAVGMVKLSSTRMSAAIFTEDGGLIDLQTKLPEDSRWVLTSASAINDHGQIVGNGTFNGLNRAFRLDLVPEPATVLALTTGLLALLKRRKR